MGFSLLCYWSETYTFAGWVPALYGAAEGGWGRPPPPPPPPSRPLHWSDYFGCLLIVLMAFYAAIVFHGFLVYDEYSVVNVIVLLLTRMHVLVMKMKSSPPAPSSWNALALLPTCPAPVLSTPPVCYEWEKPAAAMVLPASVSADSNWQSHEQDGDYKAAKKCFDSLVRHAAWTCDEQDDDYKAAMKCFDSLVRDAARICFVWSYDDAIPLTTHQSDDPSPT